jgi:hypothetical protein
MLNGSVTYRGSRTSKSLAQSVTGAIRVVMETPLLVVLLRPPRGPP